MNLVNQSKFPNLAKAKLWTSKLVQQHLLSFSNRVLLLRLTPEQLWAILSPLRKLERLLKLVIKNWQQLQEVQLIVSFGKLGFPSRLGILN